MIWFLLANRKSCTPYAIYKLTCNLENANLIYATKQNKSNPIETQWSFTRTGGIFEECFTITCVFVSNKPRHRVCFDSPRSDGQTVIDILLNKSRHANRESCSCLLFKSILVVTMCEQIKLQWRPVCGRVRHLRINRHHHRDISSVCAYFTA